MRTVLVAATTILLATAACNRTQRTNPVTAPASPQQPEPPAKSSDSSSEASAKEDVLAVAKATELLNTCPSVAIAVTASSSCSKGESYPTCRWRMPAARTMDLVYQKWRNTTLEHWWGSPKLVQTVLNSVTLYKRWHLDQEVRVGDLDAPGPRHRFHRKGVDVDLYLPGAMLVESMGANRYKKNHVGKDKEAITQLQNRVFDLARALTICGGGDTRIFYNDPVVIERFNRWHKEAGHVSSFGEPMQKHNKLHDFHFHFTLASTQRD